MSENFAPYKIGAVANFMIGRSLRDRPYITHLKLQKLVYISYGVYFAVNSGKLFHERIEAWPYGPVVPELYHEFKRFGSLSIRKWSANFDYATGKFEIPLVSDEDKLSLRALNFTWDHYGWLSAKELVEITHAEDTPWRKTYESGQKVIEDNLIQDHYYNLLNEWTPIPATS